MRKEFNSQRISLVHQHGRRFIVVEHQYGRIDVTRKCSISVELLVDTPARFPIRTLRNTRGK